MNTRDEVLEEFNANGVVYPVDTVDHMADEIVRLREQLQAVTRERNDFKTMYLDLWDSAKRHEAERNALHNHTQSAARETVTDEMVEAALDAYNMAIGHATEHREAVRFAIAEALITNTPRRDM